MVHHVNQALRAHKLFQRDKDYIVRNGEVVIIDEFTGRMMPGRRYSEGLHQALEAKERQPIQPENQTLASITFQNYFRMYEKLAGMTGTALTEADEFIDIYNLEVVEMPTNMPMVRLDDDDEVYRTAAEKYRSIITLIEDCKAARPAGAGRHHLDREVRAARRDAAPGRLGAARLLRPERVCGALFRRRGRDQGESLAILNARYHEQEAYIIAQAGVPGAVTIATNMAGRGTDIQLGGNADMRIRQELADVDGPRASASAPRGRQDPRRRSPAEGKGARGRRAVRARHRAAREPAHRQPAARPFRPPGRPRAFEVLSVPGRRPDAHLRFGEARRCCRGSG